MGIVIAALYILEVLTSVLLIGIVLIQQSKKQGGLGALAGGQTESVFGAATGNVVTRTTVILAAVFLVNTLILAHLTSRGSDGSEPSTMAEKLAKDAKTAQSATVPDSTDKAAADKAVDNGGTEAGTTDTADKTAGTPAE